MIKKTLFVHLILALLVSTMHCYPPIPIRKEFGNSVIPICTHFPQTGSSSIIGRQMLASTENYLREFKHFSTQAHTANNRLIIKLEHNLFTLNLSPLVLGITGPETLLSLLPHIKKKECLALFPIDELPNRSQTFENLIYFRPSQHKELEALAHYTVVKKSKRTIAILYEESTWGKSLLASLTKILASRNIKPIATAIYAQETVEVGNALKKLSKACPNAIFCLAQPRAAYAFISNALNVGLHNCLFLGLSHLNVIQHLLKSMRGLDIATTSVVPDPDLSTLPIAEEYRKNMISFLSFREDSPFYFEAFITMSLFEHCIQTTPAPLSLQAIIKTFESLKDFDFKGLKLSFDPHDRSLSSALWINPGQEEDVVPFIDESAS